MFQIATSYRAAKMLIERCGAETMTEAVRLVGTMLESSDLEGRTVWRQIKQAIAHLRAPLSGPLHWAV